VPEGGSLVEVTVRTAQSRLLLRPSPVLNEIVLGVFGRAQRLYGVRVHFLICLSNHWHGLASVDDALQLSRFMQYVNSNLAREVNRLVKSSGPFWSTRYRAILVSMEEAAQVDRLRYLLSNGCVSYCTSFQDLALEISAERPGGVCSGQSAGTS